MLLSSPHEFTANIQCHFWDRRRSQALLPHRLGLKLVLRLGYRKSYSKNGVLAFFAVDLYGAAQFIDDSFADDQAQSGSRNILSFWDTDAIKLLEKVRPKCLRYSKARIAYLQGYPVFNYSGAYPDFSSGPVVFDCIAYQVADQHAKADRVAARLHGLGTELHAYGQIGCGWQLLVQV